ncbi:MAG: aminotransferase class I/II-fold pyridoxal phosphate-dependent enzyme, partial [Deltaproteobacteria bacterium]
YRAKYILVTNGSIQALFMIFQALCNPGDEVIIPIPFWVSFVEQVKLAGGAPVFVHTQEYQLDSDAVQQAITPRTKAILINSPNNPSGAVYPLKDLRSIARLAAEHDLFIVADEAYESFVYDKEKHISLHEIETSREQTIVTRSFSKSYGMTGFRIGYVAATAPVIAALSRIQSHLSGNVCTFAQYGALGIPSLDDDWLMARQAEMQRKRDIAFSYASRIFKCMKPKGAFYLFPDVSAFLKPGQSARVLADHLLTEAGVAVVPGEAFGMPEHVRISFAVSEEHLTDGLERITEAL